MAIKTMYDIKFACGHKESRDLSGREAGKRASFASWLSQQDCGACFRKKNSEVTRQNDFKKAEGFEQDCKLDPLRGSDAQLKWAPIVRMDVLTRAHKHLVIDEEVSEEEFDERILNFARKIGHARWWFDNKDADGEDVEELVTTAYHDDDEASVEENPF